jgi:integrase
MFNLDRPKSDKPTYIFIRKTLTDGPFKMGLGIKIHPTHWNSETERALIVGLDKRTIDENKSINALLSSLENFIENRTRDARYSSNHLTGPELTLKIEELTGKKKSKKEGFFDHCEAIIEDMKTGKLLTPQGKKYSAGTIKNYNQYLGNFKGFNPGISFNSINVDYYRSFIQWCNEKDFSLNFIGQHINKLIVLMKESRRRGLHNNISFLDAEFKRLREDTDDISLTQKELEKLYKQNIPNPIRDIARDWFIIGCYLGLRVSDIQLLDTKNIQGGKVTIANEKTDMKVVVPLRPEIKAILKKWSGLPPKMSDQEINRSIKEVAEVCKIDEPVLYFLTKGGARRDFYMKKYEMICCHTCRRFFITTLLNEGVPDNQVMQLAGIKKHATLLRYKKTKPEETADILKDHKFFK